MPSGNVTVVSPLSPTSTFVALGFAVSTAFLTASFSGCSRLDGFLTGVTLGAVGSILKTESALRVSVLPSL